MKKFNFICLFLVIFLVGNVCCDSKKNVTEEEDEDPHKRTPVERKLLEKLLKNYNPEYLPVTQSGQTVQIAVKISLVNLPVGDSVVWHTTSPRAKWVYKWTDPRLMWNPADFEGVKVFKHFKSYNLWRPDLFDLFTQSTSFRYFMGSTYDVILSSTGEVTLYSSGQMDLDCHVSEFNYPFEEHTCEAIVGSRKYDKDELQITLLPNATDLSNFKPTKQFKLVEFKAENFIDDDPILGVPKSLIKLSLKIRRNGTSVRNDAVALTGFVSFLLVLSRFVKLGLNRMVFMLGIFIPLTYIMDEFRTKSYDPNENDSNRPLTNFIYSVAKLVCFILTCDVIIMYIMEICTRHTDSLVSRVLPLLEKLEPVLRLSPTARYFSSSAVAGSEIMSRGGGDQEQFIPVNDWKVLNLLVAFLDALLFLILCVSLFFVYVLCLPWSP